MEHSHDFSDMEEAGRVERILRRFGLQAARGLGQHFLVDEHVLRSVAEAAEPGPDAEVVEIGSGIGNLTHMLSLSGANVTAIEIDPKFQPLHQEMFSTRPPGAGKVHVHYGDALEFDYAAAAEAAIASGRRFLIVGNIPYQITSPLIMNILEIGAHFNSMTLMMQREVAERLASGPGTKKNGGISIKVQYFCEIDEIADVPPSSFLPPPEVDSRVLRFRLKPVEEQSERRDELFRLVDAAFNQRRKMMANSIAARNIGYDKEQVEAALEKCGLSRTSRAEQLGLKDFVELLRALK